MDYGTMMHLLRNPWGHPEEDVRQARLAAADALEKWQRCVSHPASAVEWIAVMQAELAALRARVAELEAACRTGLVSLNALHRGDLGEALRQALDAETGRPVKPHRSGGGTPRVQCPLTTCGHEKLCSISGKCFAIEQSTGYV